MRRTGGIERCTMPPEPSFSRSPQVRWVSRVQEPMSDPAPVTSPNPSAGLIVIRPAAEMGTKSRQTRNRFQIALRRNIAVALRRAGASRTLVQDFGRIYLETDRVDAASRALRRVFGIDNFSVVEAQCEPTLDAIVVAGERAFAPHVRGRRFAVRAKRKAGATLSTQEIHLRLGTVLKACGGIVDLDHPAVTAAVEVGGDRCLLFADRIAGPKGLPVGTGGNAVALLSGGFDSSVAAWRMLRRGVRIDYVFCNLGGGAYERMVLHVAKVLNDAWGHGHAARLHVVDFTEPLAALRAAVPAQFWQVVLKRMMYRAASTVAAATGAQAIVTGESLGQVSSQTLANLCAIEPAASVLVLRPLVGFDKQEIIDEAERIGTAALSRRIKEYCAITPSHPVTSATVERIDAAEAALDPGVLAAAVAARRELHLSRVSPEDLRAPYLFTQQVPGGAALIDCQSDEGYARWHVPGAAHWDPVALLERMHELNRQQTYVVYCSHGVQSAGVVEMMQQAGFEAYAFQGGLDTLRRTLDGAAAVPELSGI